MVRNARVMRVSACGFLNYPDVKKKGTEREKKIALEDVQLVLSDPDATGLGISYIQRGFWVVVIATLANSPLIIPINTKGRSGAH